MEWSLVGCDKNGTNCVLIIEVAEHGFPSGPVTLVSRNILPFVAPKKMTLPTSAKVAAVVNDTISSDGERVAITLSSNETAMFVVLTTKVPGRFSDNVVMVEAGQSMILEFISWEGPLTAAGLELLKSSLRVEHLAENLGV